MGTEGVLAQTYPKTLAVHTHLFLITVFVEYTQLPVYVYMLYKEENAIIHNIEYLEVESSQDAGISFLRCLQWKALID